MRIKKSPAQVTTDWQKFLHFNGHSLCLTGHCLTQLKKRFPEFYQGNSVAQILAQIREGVPLTEEFLIAGICICVLVQDKKFLVEIQSGQVITVLLLEMQTANSLAPLRYAFVQNRKWQKNRQGFKTRYRFVR